MDAATPVWNKTKEVAVETATPVWNKTKEVIVPRAEEAGKKVAAGWAFLTSKAQELAKKAAQVKHFFLCSPVFLLMIS